MRVRFATKDSRHPGPWRTTPGTMPGVIYVLDKEDNIICCVMNDMQPIASFIAAHGPKEGDDVASWRERIWADVLDAVEGNQRVPEASGLDRRTARSFRDAIVDLSRRLGLRRGVRIPRA